MRRALEQTKEGLRFKEPKSKRSRRTVSVPSLTLEALKRHRTEQRKQRLRIGPAYQDSGLICAAPDGAPWKPDNLTTAFLKLAKRAGLGDLRYHDLRHSHASQLLRQGVHPKVVSERLGHSTVAITLDTYSHVLPGIQEQAALSIDASLRAAIEAEEAKKPG